MRGRCYLPFRCSVRILLSHAHFPTDEVMNPRFQHPSRFLVIGLVVLLGFLVPGLAEGQGTDRGELRVGVSLGGTGLVGLVTEYRRDNWGAELTLGTISFREVAVSVAGKRYFSGGDLQPAVGLGLWSLTAWTEDGSGSILILRAPIAVDWNVAGGHTVGIEVALNRALAVNRLDPEDDTPPNPSLIPIPGAYYRFGWRP